MTHERAIELLEKEKASLILLKERIAELIRTLEESDAGSLTHEQNSKGASS